MTTLHELITDFETRSDPASFVFVDRGNGTGWGERGVTVRYTEINEEAYGHLEMHELPKDDVFVSEDGSTLHYASNWITGNGGYEYRIYC